MSILKQNDKGEYQTGILQCPECGSSFPEHGNEAAQDEAVKGKFKRQQTRIITAKSKNKKFYDKHGNPINDLDLIQDIMQGKTVIRYHEEKVEDKKERGR